MPAALALAALGMGCSPAADPAATPRSAPAPAAAPTATMQARAVPLDATRALAMLETRLQSDRTYPDPQCLSYENEGNAWTDMAASAAPAATPEAVDVAVREIHGGACQGDPQTAPVRDRYRVERSGTILCYDVVNGDYVGYAQRTRDRAGGML
ncbi:hypothetical protein [Xanthomonas theicola]|uniref:Lipoprotein n=1 Tax=Xanthomonas theicola TaxID=56464 RepID=A0A2S6ZII7_9XANT|nr:hypothetical protein [Xanthomonas theicola]PPT91940.1 hypothetical protein XthCFBP4691_05970 [Xanthomonas theicola]QNH27093.1 hypothetical protein G4Q83_14565 [Xanthomonas theicola]